MKNLSKPLAIICDMDGTLVDSEGFAKAIWKEAAEVIGYDLPDELFLSMVGTSVAKSNEILLGHFGANFSLDMLRAKKLEIENLSYGKGLLKEKQGAKRFLETVKQFNIPLGLGTTTEKVRAEKRLLEVQLLDYFDYSLFGDQVKKQKPDPETYHEVAKFLNVDIKSCLIVEDSPTGVRAGISSGAQVAWIKDQVEIPEDLKKSIYSFDSLDSLREELVKLFTN